MGPKNNKSTAKQNKRKITLANPFSVEWPSVEETNKTAIADSLRDSLNQDGARENFVFGFNGVMRALEKDSVAAVFVNKSAKPASLALSFIPACTIRSVPVVAIEALSQMTSPIGIKSCLAIALSLPASLQEHPLHSLYSNCCQALNLPLRSSDGDEEKHSESSSDDESASSEEESDSSTGEKPSSISTSLPKQTFHLKRNSKLKRVFHPEASGISSSMDMILINDPRSSPPRVTNKRKAPHYAETSIKNIKKNPNRKKMM